MIIPAGWALARVGEFTVDKVEQREPSAEPVDYVDIGSIDRGRKVIGPTEKVTGASAPTRARQWIREGDVLVSMTRPNLNAVALVPAALTGAVASTGFDVLRSIVVLPEWVFYRVRSEAFITDVCKDVQGVVYPAIRPDDVRGHILPIAPVAEQRRIVEALDSYVSRLDAAIGSLERVRAKLKAYRASVLKAAVEGRLVRPESELARKEKRTYEPADALLTRIVAERRRRWEEAELAKLKAAGKTPKDDKWKAKYVAPAAPDASNLPELQEGWCWVTVDQLAADEPNSLCDGPFGSNLKSQHYREAGPRVIRLQNIGDGEFRDARACISEAHFATLRKHEVFGGDLVIASLGTEVPRACRVPHWLGRAIVKADCLRFKVDEHLADPTFVLCALNSPSTRKRAERLVHGVGRPRMGLSLFRSLPIPLPPRVEQVRIVEVAEARLSVAAATGGQLVANEVRCGRLRQSVLRWAFEGRLVDQDPRDEPADDLLARLRADRAGGSSTKNPRASNAKASS